MFKKIKFKKIKLCTQSIIILIITIALTLSVFITGMVLGIQQLTGDDGYVDGDSDGYGDQDLLQESYVVSLTMDYVATSTRTPAMFKYTPTSSAEYRLELSGVQFVYVYILTENSQAAKSNPYKTIWVGSDTITSSFDLTLGTTYYFYIANTEEASIGLKLTYGELVDDIDIYDIYNSTHTTSTNNPAMFTYTPTEAGDYMLNLTGISSATIKVLDDNTKTALDSPEYTVTTTGTANSESFSLNADTKYYFYITNDLEETIGMKIIKTTDVILESYDIDTLNDSFFYPDRSSNTVMYKYTPTTTGDYMLKMRGITSASVKLLTENSYEAIDESTQTINVTGSDYSSTFSLIAGITYYFYVENAEEQSINMLIASVNDPIVEEYNVTQLYDSSYSTAYHNPAMYQYTVTTSGYYTLNMIGMESAHIKVLESNTIGSLLSPEYSIALIENIDSSSMYLTSGTYYFYVVEDNSDYSVELKIA